MSSLAEEGVVGVSKAGTGSSMMVEMLTLRALGAGASYSMNGSRVTTVEVIM